MDGGFSVALLSPVFSYRGCSRSRLTPTSHRQGSNEVTQNHHVTHSLVMVEAVTPGLEGWGRDVRRFSCPFIMMERVSGLCNNPGPHQSFPGRDSGVGQSGPRATSAGSRGPTLAFRWLILKWYGLLSRPTSPSSSGSACPALAAPRRRGRRGCPPQCAYLCSRHQRATRLARLHAKVRARACPLAFVAVTRARIILSFVALGLMGTHVNAAEVELADGGALQGGQPGSWALKT